MRRRYRCDASDVSLAMEVSRMRWVITVIGSVIIFGLVAYAVYDCAPRGRRIDGGTPTKGK